MDKEVDNILVESLKSSPTKAILMELKITYPIDISSDEEEEESKDESDSLSSKLGSVVMKPSAKATTTLTSKGSVQTEFVPDLTNQQKASVATKKENLLLQ